MSQRRDLGPPLKDRLYTTLYRLRYGKQSLRYPIKPLVHLSVWPRRLFLQAGNFVLVSKSPNTLPSGCWASATTEMPRTVSLVVFNYALLYLSMRIGS